MCFSLLACLTMRSMLTLGSFGDKTCSFNSWVLTFTVDSSCDETSFHDGVRASMGVDTMNQRESHFSPHSEWRNEGRHFFFAWHSRDARDTEGTSLGRYHQRVRSRMLGQRLVDAVAADQRTDGHLDTDIDVRVTSKSIFPMLTSASSRIVELRGDLGAECIVHQLHSTQLQRLK